MDMFSYLTIINNQKQQEISKIKKCNEYTNRYGLTLTEEQINDIVEKRYETLKDTQRVEFGEWIIDKIIKEFCDSPYIRKDNYAETIYELIDMFYFYKNETKELVTDDELIKFMKKHFDGICQGSLEYLSGTILEKMTDNILKGKPLDYFINIKSLESNEEYEDEEYE